MNIDKKKIIVGIVVIVIIAVIAFFVFGLDTKTLNIKTNENISVVKTEVQKRGYLLTNKQAKNQVKDVYKNSPEFKKCEKNGVAVCVRELVLNKIRETGNIALCNDIPDANVQKNCKTSMAIELAVKNNDVKVCEVLKGKELENCKNQVVSSSALKEGDETKCDVLTNNGKKGCVEMVVMQKVRETGEKSLCQKLDDGSKFMCEEEAKMFVKQ